MKIPFSKYQGTGNDFVLIDQRKNQYLNKTDAAIIAQLCDRKFGVGADGLILLQKKEGYDFEMIYFNADGNESSLCGNGGRCIVAFAHRLGLIKNACTFWAIDGKHEAKIGEKSWIDLKMQDVDEMEVGEDYYILNTGSPHYIIMVEDVDDIDVVEIGSAIRYSKRFKQEGINVNFVEWNKKELIVATYERGVENETLSCGTGVTAAAIAFARHQKKTINSIPIQTKGGDLAVKFNADSGLRLFSNIWLSGPATFVFEGTIEI